MEAKTIGVRAATNPGDLFCALPALKRYNELTGNKINLYLWLDRPALYYEGAKHPTLTDGVQVMMNKTVFDAVRPLLLEQEYFSDILPWNGEEYLFALDEHLNFNINKWFVHLSRLYFYIFPDLNTDLSRPILQVSESNYDLARGKVLICRTERYFNSMISYHFLKKYESHLLFVGLWHEREKFCKDFNLEVPWLQTDTFLELAQAIKQCRFLVSNQTSIFQLAELQKTPRILEICHAAPNVCPVGPNGFDFMYQKGLEYYFDKLLNS